MLLPEARAEDHDHAPTARIKKVSTLQSFYGFDEVCTVIMSEWDTCVIERTRTRRAGD